MKKPITTSIALLIILGVGAIYGIYLKKDTALTKLNSKLPVPAPRVVGDFTIQAWIYPGPPSCNAMNELADGRHLDVIKAEYFALDESGKLALLSETDAGCNGFSEQNVEKLKMYSSYQYVTVAANHLTMREMFKSSDSVSFALNTLVTFVTDHNLSGVEIDFEDFSAWTKQDYQNYKAFLMQLGTDLRSYNKKLMVDGPPLNEENEIHFLWRYEEIAQLPVDQIVVMAYDYQYDYGKGTPVAPNEWVKDVYDYTVKHVVDTNKIVIGIPSYGYHNDEKDRIILDTNEQSQKYNGFQTARYDNKSFEKYWEIGDNYYRFVDADGLKEKVQFVKSLGAKSVSIWHLGGNAWIN